MKYFWILGLMTTFACGQNKKETVQPIDTATLLQSQQNQVKVDEVLQTSSYTYLRVSGNSKNYWIAVVRTNAEIGDNFYYEGGLEMKDFRSKEHDRVFDQVLFVDKISASPFEHEIAKKHTGHSNKKATGLNAGIRLDPPGGGISIAELYSNKEKYNGKRIWVRGKVVKVNRMIMNRNWIHLQDGTSNDGKFDLTVTTTDHVNKGDTVTMNGIVSLNKDFGSGYFYELIVEKASVK